MENVLLWAGLALLIAILTFMNHKRLYSGSVRTTLSELGRLTGRVKSGESAAQDLAAWETALQRLEKHPNEFNKLDMEIGLRSAFTAYLERHFPDDPRLPSLREAAAYRKDSVWGIKIFNL